MTLAVRMGRANAVNLYRMLVLGAYVVLPIALVAGEGSLLPLIGLLSLPLAVKPLRTMTNRTDGPSLNGALAGDRRPARRLQPARLARPAARQLSPPERLWAMRTRLGRGHPLRAPLPRSPT